MPRDITLLDNELTLGQNVDGTFLRHDQVITQDFLDGLHSQRLAQAAIRSRDYHAVADVPTAVVELWTRQGFDFWRMTPREIVDKLRTDNLQAFIATSKRV